MKNIATFLKPYKLAIIIAYALTFIELITELLFPFFLGMIIDQGIIPQNMDVIIFWGSIMLGLSVFTFLMGIINSYFASHVGNSYAYDVRAKLFAMIQQFTFEQLSKFPTSGLVTRFTNDVRQVQNTIFMALRIMAKAPFMIIGGVIMAFIVNVKLAAIFLITVPILTVFLFWVLKKGSVMFKNVQQNVDEVNRVLQENIAGIRVIKAFVTRRFEKSRFSQANKDLATTTQTAFRFMEAAMPVLLFVMNMSLLFIIWYGNRQTIAGTVQVGDVVAIVNYALRIVMAISMLAFITMAFSRAKASSERIDNVLNEKMDKIPVDTTYGDPAKNTITNGAITFQNVSFEYPASNIAVLEKISFAIDGGSTLAVIGSTGSGKTTMFQLLPRLYEPNEGSIFIDGTSLTAYEPNLLRNEIGYVPQSPLLFTGTIADNLRFGKADASDDALIQAAKDAQIHETIMAFPNGYDTIVGQRGVNLSGGQKQRISIARALVRQPKILMLDDSTSALDLATEAKLLQAISKYDCTLLLITQKVSTAKQADNILLLDDGKCLAVGSHDTLMRTSPLYERIVDSQLEEEVPYV